ncbi:MAG: BREX-1 system adenine-specific DNA-methyltransferase PglX, partial [Gemmatimonadota bacterium]|nr:BREX-1 system adenine-specific DNA-methyltransferase PglX [Gemmatimonadota bacterium]
MAATGGYMSTGSEQVAYRGAPRVLDRTHRRALEQTVRKARRIAEAGSRQALEHLAVAHHEPRGHLSADQRALRNRLRARARQLGDKRDARGAQQIDRLIEQCAYEHWHRMLFARFLAENDLLIEPASGVPISLTDCRALAAQQGKPWIEVASEYAVRMLSQVFRLDDPVLELHLPAEHRADLEVLLEALPVDVFTATDSLGWTYQFWQADAKDAVNASEVKIGARELAPVTQLFTEDYMVDFLLHNTLGAWWAGKQGPIAEASEAEARGRAALPARDGLPAVEWQYLRFVAGDNGTWQPAAGTFDGWPKSAREITMLDPCMGSGHFLVFALPLLARLEMEEERLSGRDAVDTVLRENLFGLELDDRCTQIAAFNLALTAWRLAGHPRLLPQLNLACSGLSISASEEEWVALAGSDTARAGEMKALYQAFKNAPLLGSLIDPRSIVRSTWSDSRGGRDQRALFETGPQSLASMLTQAVERQTRDEAFHELAVTARGVAKAAEILSSEFTLVATNVPYLGRGKQSDELKEYAKLHHGPAKADLATCFVERCLEFCASGASTALVTPQNWLFLGTYKHLRKHLLTECEWSVVGRLGPRAFETISGEVVNVALIAVTHRAPGEAHAFVGLDASAAATAAEKAYSLEDANLVVVSQRGQLSNPDVRVTFIGPSRLPLLREFVDSYQGTTTGDNARFLRAFWEVSQNEVTWSPFQGAPRATAPSGGCDLMIRWENGLGDLARSRRARVQGQAAFGRRGFIVGQMRSLPVTRYSGEFFSMNGAALVPRNPNDLSALWAYCSSGEFRDAVRAIDQKLNVTNAVLVKIPFDVERWRRNGDGPASVTLPRPSTVDPTQWTFDGDISSTAPLQVSIARLVGYGWPRQAGRGFLDCPAVGTDPLDPRADEDGILC